MLIIVAVVIIMAELTTEVKACPVFDRASLQEKYGNFLTRNAIEPVLRGSQVRLGMEQPPGGV
jgi:hypothetical protein